MLKQHRGHSGIGVWRIAQEGHDVFTVRHAQRGASEEHGPFSLVLERLAPYFAHGGHVVDQAWQPRLVEGMVRAYLVRDRVAGFGHQAVNSLYPAAAGEVAPEPGPRWYSGPDDPRFQQLRHRLENHWVELLSDRLGIDRDRLPVPWDADFIQGEVEDSTQARHVLCEINVSSVAPYPESANAAIVEAVRSILA